MKNRILYLIAFIAMITASCKKSFLTDIPPYGNLDESAFTNVTQTGWYIDRMYNYYFAAFKSPTQQESSSAGTGTYDDSKTKNTEEIGGTVGSFINPNLTYTAATNGDTYYGAALPAGTANNAYTRIRMANFLLQKIDGVGKVLPASFKATAKGQMYYFRALEYYYLVRVYGGVPLVLTVSEASSTDSTIRTPRSTATQCFAQIMSDFDSAAALLPATWTSTASTNYGRFTSAAALAMKSRVSLYAASPLFNSDWDNPGSAKWQTALKAGLDAETYLTNNGYGLYGSSAKDWQAMTYVSSNTTFNKEAIYIQLLSSSNPATTTTAFNNSWEASIRPKDMGGSGNGVAAPKGMIDLFPLADGTRPTKANGYVDTFFFVNRDPRFYRTFAFSGSKWGMKQNASRTTFFYRWKTSATATASTYYGYNAGNQSSSPAEVFKFSNPAADSSGFAYSGTSIFDYRYAELLLNIAECYAATGDIANCTLYLGKIRARVGIPSANNYGIGALAGKYAAIEACLYERRVELAYEGKRYWDIQRWLLYDGTSSTYTGSNTCDILGLPHINGTSRTGYYWQSKTVSAATVDPLTATDKNILIDPDNTATFATQIAALKALYQAKFVVTPLDASMDIASGSSTGTTILFRPNYYLSGLTATILGQNPWLLQNIGWTDYSGTSGTFNATQ